MGPTYCWAADGSPQGGHSGLLFEGSLSFRLPPGQHLRQSSRDHPDMPPVKSEFRTIHEPITGAESITASDTVDCEKGRQLAVMCSEAGNVRVQLLDGSTLTFPVGEGMTVVPWVVTRVFITGTTATATFANLV